MEVSTGFSGAENMMNSTGPGESRVQTGNHWQPGPESCAACGNFIYDRTMIRVKDKVMHSACLRCTSCDQEVMDMCFSDGNEVYCQYDFQRIFGAECAGCLGMIGPTESVHRAEQKIYHQNCFCCVHCQSPLQTGDKFYLRDDDKLLCDRDYQKLSNEDKRSSSVDSDSEDSSSEVVIRHKSRSNISYQQLKFLRHAYKSNPRPSRNIRRQISAQTGLDTKIVQIWFQNKRSKDRRRRLRGNNTSHDSGLISDMEDTTGTVIAETAYSQRAGPQLNNHDMAPDSTTHTNSKLQEWLKNLDSLAVDAVPPNIELKVSDFRPNGEISITSVNWTHAQCQEEFWFQRQTVNPSLLPCGWLPGL